MPALTTLKDLLVDELKDLHSAEKQLTKALPKMAKAATNPTLKQGFTDHLEQTKGHLARLEQALDLLGEKPGGKTCKAMKGLVEEGAEAIEEDALPEIKDAALIGAAQRVEHYEMAGYGVSRSFAQALGESEVAELLTATFNEEVATDKKLTVVSKTVNKAALAAGASEDEEKD